MWGNRNERGSERPRDVEKTEDESRGRERLLTNECIDVRAADYHIIAYSGGGGSSRGGSANDASGMNCAASPTSRTEEHSNLPSSAGSSRILAHFSLQQAFGLRREVSVYNEVRYRQIYAIIAKLLSC